MKIKKRKKRSRLRGAKTCGYGFRKSHKGGKGEKGGKGMAGTGKKAGQKITWIQRYMPDYFGKRGFASLKKKHFNAINLDEINNKIEKLLHKGKAKKTPEGIEINLQGFKVLGRGEVKQKLLIHAGAFSKEAESKIIKAGGKVIKLKEDTKK